MIDSYSLCNYVIEQLCTGAQNKLNSDLQHIVNAFSEYSGKEQDGFLYMRKWITTKPIMPNLSQQQGLPTELVPMMQEYQEDSNQLKHDIESMTQCMHLLCLHVNTLIDLRNTLPESVVRFIPDIANLERTQSAGYSLAKLPKTAQQHFDKMLPIFQKYSALNLIY